MVNGYITSFTAPRVTPSEGAPRRRELYSSEFSPVCKYRVQKEGNIKEYDIKKLSFPSDDRIKIVYEKNSETVEKEFRIPPTHKEELSQFEYGFSVSFHKAKEKVTRKTNLDAGKTELVKQPLEKEELLICYSTKADLEREKNQQLQDLSDTRELVELTVAEISENLRQIAKGIHQGSRESREPKSQNPSQSDIKSTSLGSTKEKESPKNQSDQEGSSPLSQDAKSNNNEPEKKQRKQVQTQPNQKPLFQVQTLEESKKENQRKTVEQTAQNERETRELQEKLDQQLKEQKERYAKERKDLQEQSAAELTEMDKANAKFLQKQEKANQAFINTVQTTTTSAAQRQLAQIEQDYQAKMQHTEQDAAAKKAKIQAESKRSELEHQQKMQQMEFKHQQKMAALKTAATIQTQETLPSTTETSDENSPTAQPLDKKISSLMKRILKFAWNPIPWNSKPLATWQKAINFPLSVVILGVSSPILTVLGIALLGTRASQFFKS